MTRTDPQTPPPARPRRTRKDEIKALQAELEARIAEAEWLKAHYDEQLRTALGQVASLRARARFPAVAAQPTARPDALDQAELERVRAELDRLAMAERRYLDRIEELKEALGRGPGY